MTRHDVAVFIGTRPECIKLAPVVRAIDATRTLRAIVVDTGQHRELLDQALAFFGLRVDRRLPTVTRDRTLASLTAQLVESIDSALADIRPAFAVAQGDTTTVLATALASFYRGVPFGHVEAGLRSGDLTAPFPEEANRALVARLARLHFAPTDRARANLLAEGVARASVSVTGNPGIDSLCAELDRQRAPAVHAELDRAIADLAGERWQRAPLVLVTGHRRESLGPPLERICSAVRDLATRFREACIVYATHPSPQVQSIVGVLAGEPNVRVVPPLPYDRLVALLARSRLVLTDSGGIQEEAPWLGAPVLVLREVTERHEGVEAGVATLVGTDPERIVACASKLLTDDAAHARAAHAARPYGDGAAAPRIALAIESALALGSSLS